MESRSAARLVIGRASLSTNGIIERPLTARHPIGASPRPRADLLSNRSRRDLSRSRSTQRMLRPWPHSLVRPAQLLSPIRHPQRQANRAANGQHRRTFVGGRMRAACRGRRTRLFWRQGACDTVNLPAVGPDPSGIACEGMAVLATRRFPVPRITASPRSCRRSAARSCAHWRSGS